MRLRECKRGDLVVVRWQHPSTPNLNGKLQLVRYNAPCREDGAYVDRFDMETHEMVRNSWRVISDTEVVSIVERHHAPMLSNDAETDPMQTGRRR